MDSKLMSKATPPREAPGNYLNDGATSFPEMGCGHDSLVEIGEYDDYMSRWKKQASFESHAMARGS